MSTSIQSLQLLHYKIYTILHPQKCLFLRKARNFMPKKIYDSTVSHDKQEVSWVGGFNRELV